jgi:glycosyltransferase 2 family protein
MTTRGGKRHWVQLLGVVLSIAAVAVLVQTVDLERVVETMLRADLRLVGLAAGTVLIQLVIVTARWRILLARLGATVSIVRLIGPVLLGYLGNFVLPARLGEVIRAYAVARRERMEMSELLGSVVLERVIDASVLAVIAAALAVFLDATTWIVRVSLIAAIGGVAVLAILASPAGTVIGRRLGGSSVAGVRRIGITIAGFAVGSSLGTQPVAVLLAAILSAASWVLEGTVYWLVAQSLGIDITPAAAFLVAAVTVLATAVPSAPAYVGTFELAATAVATSFGVPPAAALAWATVAHATTVAPLAIGGIAALLRSRESATELVAEAEAEAGIVARSDVPAVRGHGGT